MKHLYTIGFILLAFCAFGQGNLTINNGSITNKSSMYIKGNLTHKSTGTFNNTGKISIEGNIQNQAKNNVFADGVGSDESGMLIFKGNQDQTIAGNSAIFFHNIIIDKSGGEIILNDSIRVSGQLKLIKGNLFLNNHEVYLFAEKTGLFGHLQGEENDKRIYDQTEGSGTIRFEKSGYDVNNDKRYQSLGLAIESTDSYDMKLIRGHGKQGGKEINAGPGDGSIDRYFDLHESSGTKSIVQLSTRYFESEISDPAYNEKEFVLWSSFDQGLKWEKQWDEKSERYYTEDSLVSYRNQLAKTKQRFTIAPENCSKNPPLAFAKDTLFLCTGDSLLLDPELPGLTYLWSTGQQDPTIWVKNPGKYKLHVWNTSGCESFDSLLVIEKPVPIAIAKTKEVAVCDQIAVEFESLTDLNGNNEAQVTYAWNFDDSGNPSATSNQKNPVYTYSTYGTFNAVLEVSTKFGCQHDTTVSVVVHEIPEANFTIENTCTDNPVTIQNTSSSNYINRNLLYQWSFSDGTTSTNDIPDKTFTQDGPQEIQLIVHPSGIACYDTLIRQIEVKPKPVIDVNYLNLVCENQDLTIQNKSTVKNNTLTYSWDFGDSQSSKLKDPVKSYSTPGFYDIQFKAFSGEGCFAEAILPVEVKALPEIEVSYNPNTCMGEVVFFDVLKPVSGTHQYTWDFDNGYTSNAQTESVSFNNPGNYYVSLTVSDEFGCTSTENAPMQVHDFPLVDFTINPDCEGDVLEINNLTTVNSGNLDFLWSFGDDTYSDDQNPAKSYQESGTFEVKLQAESSFGCAAETAKSVEVFDNPVIDLADDIETCGSTITLDSFTAGASYQWSNGANTRSSTFTASGGYWLEVISTDNCVSRQDFNVTLNTAITPDLGSDNTFCGEGELDAGYPGASYVWSDGSTSRYLSVSQSGYYSVDITDQNGCTGSANTNVVINPLPVLDLGDNVGICSNEGITLDAGNPGSTYLWSTGSRQQKIQVTNRGVYGVEVTNYFGCEANDQVVVDLMDLPQLAIPTEMTGCDLVTLDAGGGYDFYQWSTGAYSRTIQVAQTGNYEVEVGFNNGCKASRNIAVKVNTSPQFSLGTDQTICHGNSAYLDPGLTSEFDYDWSTGDRTETLFADATGYYSLIITSPEECTYEDEVYVEVLPALIVDLPEEKLVCRGQDALLTVGEPGNEYSWYINGVEQINLQNAHIINIDTAGTYKVVVANEIGCSASDSMRVFLTTNSINADFLVSSLANVGDSLSFIQLTQPEPTWYLWEFGDGSNSYEYNPIYTYYIPGEYKVLLTASNDVCTDTLSKNIVIQSLKQLDIVEEGDFDLLLAVEDLKIYPNPVNNYFNLEMKLSRPAHFQVFLYSLNGVVLKSFSGEGKVIKQTINTSRFIHGLMLMRIVINHDIVISKRILKL